MELTLEELEQADDHAHTSGRAKALERAGRAVLEDDPAGMAERWRERAERHRNTACLLCDVLRYLHLHPENPAIRFEGCDWAAPAARKELAYQRDRHRQCCGQLGFWLRQRPQHQQPQQRGVR